MRCDLGLTITPISRLAVDMKFRIHSWLVGVEFNAPLDTSISTDFTWISMDISITIDASVSCIHRLESYTGTRTCHHSQPSPLFLSPSPQGWPPSAPRLRRLCPHPHPVPTVVVRIPIPAPVVQNFFSATYKSSASVIQ